jgi:hypothetical protein
VSNLTRKRPLQALIARAARTMPVVPASGSGIVAHYQQRIDSGGVGQVVLLDVSSSMAEMAGALPKIDILRDALARAPPARLIAFGSVPREILSIWELPAPAGGTALHSALVLAATMRPARTLVISDGEPDDEQAALTAARNLPGVIDVLYVGPDDNARAKAFLMSLARAGGGRYEWREIWRVPKEIGPVVRSMMLTAGKPRP